MLTGTKPNSLQLRLSAVRRRWRLVVTFRGICWLATALLTPAALAGLLDWGLPGHLPSLVRVVVLAGALSAACYVAYRFLLHPLLSRVDDLTLALRVETFYPALNDSLASTVQFLEQPPDSEGAGSLGLRRAVVQQTFNQVRSCNFNQVVDSRGLGAAGLSLTGSLSLAVTLCLLFPGVAWTALARLANPFGNLDWPRQTQIRLLDFRARIARGEPYEIRCEITGVVPEFAAVEFKGTGLGTQTYRLNRGQMVARLDQLEHNFRFQVRANDAVTPWHAVAVLPPPVLVPLDGRASPQVRLDYPAYTDLLPQDLPDGSGNIDAVAGTHVTWRAATDRPVATAWIEYLPEAPLVRESAMLSSVGQPYWINALAATVCGREVWQRLPVRLGDNGQVLVAEFVPRVTGVYALHFEDASGLANHRLFDLRVFTDPTPVVNLERPSPSHDSLDLLPDAEVHIQVLAEDKQFALRSVFLEYRSERSDPARVLPLYDHRAIGGVIPGLLAKLALAPLPASAPIPIPESLLPGLRLRPQRLQISQQLSLQQISHWDGSRLREGDIVTVQACADDFDNVAVDKEPGRSQEVELRIVSKETLEKNLNQAQREVQQELLRLRRVQQEALGHVIGAEQHWRNTGRLRPRDIDKLIQAEQLQQQIRARIGKKDEGLRADVERLLQTFRDNHLPRSGAQERMETVAGELGRLAREEVDQIEPRLTTAREDNDIATAAKKPPQGIKGPLGEAREHQEEVENTLANLLKLLEPWGNLNEVKGETKTILHEQQKLREESRKLADHIAAGTNLNALEPEQKAGLDQTAELQKKLADRTDQLLSKMARVSAEQANQDPETARAIKKAASQGRQQALTGNMQGAAQNLQNNKLGTATRQQGDSIRTLEQMAQTLENRREEELDQLRKKLQQVQEKLADLARRQEELRKKIQQAQQQSDPKKRERQLQTLAREQERLRKEAQEMVRELTRLRAEGASQALSGAAGSMEQASRQLTRGQNADDAQEDTLDRLNEARRRLQQNQQEVEEELAREKLVRVADQLKQLKERQEARSADLAGILQDVLQRKGWNRPLLSRLNDLADGQKDLAMETHDLARGKLADAKVFAHILEKSAQAMDRAAQFMQKRTKGELDQASADQEMGQQQRIALRRINQLLEALKFSPTAPALKRQGQPGGGSGGNGGSRGGDGDAIPHLAQLKALRTLQQEVNEQTEAFAKHHPDLKKLSAKDQKELQAIRASQQEVADLLDELTAPAAREGELK